MTAKPRSIDEYLASVPVERRAALQKLRQVIRRCLPSAEECISYSMPAFRYEGRVVAGFQATARGCSYYPFSGTTLATLSSELSAYEQTKSALHFAPDRPLPAALVRRLLDARIAEGRGRAKVSAASRAPARGPSQRRPATAPAARGRSGRR